MDALKAVRMYNVEKSVATKSSCHIGILNNWITTKNG